MQWYVTREGAIHGPLSEREFALFCKLGHVRAEDFVWSQALGDWMDGATFLARIGTPAEQAAPLYEPAPINRTPPQAAPRDGVFLDALSAALGGSSWSAASDRAAAPEDISDSTSLSTAAPEMAAALRALQAGLADASSRAPMQTAGKPPHATAPERASVSSARDPGLPVHVAAPPGYTGAYVATAQPARLPTRFQSDGRAAHVAAEQGGAWWQASSRLTSAWGSVVATVDGARDEIMEAARRNLPAQAAALQAQVQRLGLDTYLDSIYGLLARLDDMEMRDLFTEERMRNLAESSLDALPNTVRWTVMLTVGRETYERTFVSLMLQIKVHMTEDDLTSRPSQFARRRLQSAEFARLGRSMAGDLKAHMANSLAPRLAASGGA
ncbi:MAG: GYF domain-containing protein [Hyphomicrobiaceae bacterium]